MYLLIGLIPLAMGIILLRCAGKGANWLKKVAAVMIVLGILLTVASLGILVLVLSGRIMLPLK